LQYFRRFTLFGYIKPLADDLKMREFELYKSFYCGLCKTMGVFARVTLNYDMVFLALVRVALSGGKIENKSFRCALKPWKKRAYIKSNESLAYSASIAGILTYYKCIDDRRDTKNKLKKFIFSLISVFFLRGKNKACARYPELDEKIKESLENLNNLEKNKCASIDETAAAFAGLMQTAASFGLESNARIAEQIGWHLGRWLYIIDAIDDLSKDLKKREYNAFIEYYGDKNKFAQDLDNIKYSLTSSLEQINTAFSLLADSPVSPIILNIINLGLCDVQEKILKNNKQGGFFHAESL